MRIAFTTFGCKINQFESDVLRRDFEMLGNTIVPFDAAADVYIINTCSVTAKSDYQCRQAIRAAIRRGQGAQVVVTGCYAQTRPEEIRKIPGVAHIIGNIDKAALVDRVLSACVSACGPTTRSSSPVHAKTLRSRTRGFLKIQDGCDNHCSYCIVPLARGASRSVALRDVVRAFQDLVQAKCPEVVLSGIHIGMYGSDLDEETSLSELLKILIASRDQTRIRLSSIEPGEITSELVGLLGKGLCRHLHIPLQSGDDAILSSMNRTYTSGFYRELTERIAQLVPGIALGADVMVGFPGEGEREFQNTMHLVEKSPLTHLHIFSYSSRPGTLAADMKGQVSEVTKKERSQALRELGKKKNLKFRQIHQGAELDVVVEDKLDASTGLLTGVTDNYLRVHIDRAKSEHIGEKIGVRIKDVNEQLTIAELL
jgi:threonylcarbamoyladenosine tRNA methylthiotransferase MtaB